LEARSGTLEDVDIPSTIVVTAIRVAAIAAVIGAIVARVRSLRRRR